MSMGIESVHVATPHFAGQLFGCPACEAECQCQPNETQCVHCAVKEETAIFSAKQTAYMDRFSY
jgi:hypothetical protein